MKWLRRSLLILLLLFMAAPKLWAQNGGEQILNFVARIKIDRDNVASITEIITYNFGDLEKHGILRFVPIKTDAGGGKFYFYNFKFIDATIDGRTVLSKVERDNSWQTIRLGNPEHTTTGVHTYIINYQMRPLIEKTVEGDYLNWNLTGNYWQVPIANASAIVQFPSGVEIKNVRCYSGATGSTAQACRLSTLDNQVQINGNGVLNAYEGLTLNALIDSGSVNNYLSAHKPPLTDYLPWLGVLTGIGALLAGAAARLIGWIKHKRKLASQTVVAQYESPDKLTPGEIGLLNDNRADMTEITATLVDLAVRGYIKIEQTQSKSIFKKAKYTFHKLKVLAKPKPHEARLLKLLFGDRSQAKALEDISATEAGQAIRKVKTLLKKSLKEKGYYELPTKTKTRTKLKIAIFGLIFGILFVNLYSLDNGANPTLIVWSTISIILFSILGWAFSRRTRFTEAGYKEWAQVEGFRLFMSVTAKERLAFSDAPAKNPQQFSALLPFAIALGVEKQWAKQFTDMNVARTAGWYYGTGNFNCVALASSLSSDFSSAVSSNFTPTQSSSGFSGGGSSGGGGGGGGGGSW